MAETKTEIKTETTPVDHGFARQLLGANHFRRVKDTDDYERVVVSLTYGATFTFRISHPEEGKATLTITRKADGKSVIKTDTIVEIYTDAIAYAHRLF
jgi:hypothetical protein